MKLVLCLLVLGSTPFAQASHSALDAPNVVVERNDPPIRRLLDFDLDGDPDGVGAWLNSNGSAYRLSGYRNDGQGGFQHASQTGASTGAGQNAELQIEVGFLNADAWPDVCILVRQQRHDWYSQGNGHFTAQPPVALPGPARDLVLVELDGDGIDDCVWIDGGRLNLAGSLGTTTQLQVSGNKHGVRVLARDGPAGDDVFLVHVNRQVRVFFGNPQSGFTTGPVLQHDLDNAMMDVGDIDGDLDIDAVVFGALEYRVLRRTGADSFEVEPSQYGGPAEFLRDVDGDGDLDGACCGGGGGGGPTYPDDNTDPTEFQIALNDGSGSFAPAFQIPGLGSPQLAGVLDVDGDGDADLVAGRCVYLADGSIQAPREVGIVPPIHGRRALSDCDGDGDIDVGFSVASVFSNDGSGDFAEIPTTTWPAPRGTRFHGPGYQGDFDGDGSVDLVVELRPAERLGRFEGQLPGHARPVAMALLRNDGWGGLQRAVPASDQGVSFAFDSQDPELSLLIDADLDGDLDLLTRSLSHVFQEAGTQLWANDGSGRFRAGGRLPSTRAIWAGDVNADGVLDLITCGAGYEGTSTYLRLGSDPLPGRLPTMTWDSRPGYWPQQASAGIAEADFDLDGYPEFATLHTAPSAFIPQGVVYRNDFAIGGSLVQRSGLTHGVPGSLAHGARVSLADLNGDATVDALVGPIDDEQIEISAVSLNQLTGTIQYNSFESTLQLVPPGFLVDLDADGDVDLLGSRIVFNRSQP